MHLCEIHPTALYNTLVTPREASLVLPLDYLVFRRVFSLMERRLLHLCKFN